VLETPPLLLAFGVTEADGDLGAAFGTDTGDFGVASAFATEGEVSVAGVAGLAGLEAV